jgi:hypothetical protein
MAGKVNSIFQVGDKIISMDIIEEKFICDLSKCKGNCCVLGASGAPLEDDEIVILREIYPRIKPYLRPEAVKTIEKHGTAMVDSDKEWVTPLIKGMECVYAIFEDGIARCAIEKAFEDRVITFRKPISCHLYPVRIKKFEHFEAVNYDRQRICDPARDLGKELNLPVFEFVEEALLRKYDKAFISKLKRIAAEVQKQRKEI